MSGSTSTTPEKAMEEMAAKLEALTKSNEEAIAAMKEAEERVQAAEAKAQEAESAAVRAAKSTPKNDKQAKLNAEFWAKRDKLNR